LSSEKLSLPRSGGHDDGAQRAHGAAFGGRGHAQEDGAQHQEDQQQRRDQHEGDALGHARQQAQAGHLVEHRDHESQQHARAHGHHDGLVLGHLATSLALHQL
jgi:hypothetical protein